MVGFLRETCKFYFALLTIVNPGNACKVRVIVAVCVGQYNIAIAVCFLPHTTRDGDLVLEE